MAFSTDVLSAVNGASNTANASKSTAQATQDRFLKLLVAQLNSQDPMNPMDNAQMTSQMAQLNTVTGIEALNDTVSTVLSQMASMQTLQGANMIGRDVLTPGNQLQVINDVGRGHFDLAVPADNVKVEIRTAGGTLLDTLEGGALSAGRQGFQWDASQYSGSEALQFKVTATASKLPVTATTLQRTTVGAVSTENNALMLQMVDGTSVPYSTVKSVL